jgi:DNA polymerase-3 subunit delta'
MKAFALHAALWQELEASRERLPHALLFCGMRGLGKREFSLAFAQSLLCENRQGNGEACGLCDACRWFAEGNHPDFRLLAPLALQAKEEGKEKDEKKRSGQQVAIEQVRALDEFLSVGASRQGLRVILAHPAESMTRAAANALLKMLEEPPPETVFLLVSNEPMRLLPTIRSRCRMLPVPVPPVDLSLRFLEEAGVEGASDWLALAGRAPLLALSLAREAQKGGDPGRAALLKAMEAGGSLEVLAESERMAKAVREVKGENPLPKLMEWAQKWLIDLNLAAAGMPARFFLRQGAKIASLAGQSNSVALSRFYRKLLALRRESGHTLNVQLFWEQFFFDYRALFSG